MIEGILREKMGLSVDSVGRGKVDSDVKRRMDACGLHDRGAYARLLLSSPQEMDALIALTTISETWFFRAYDSFIYLESFLRDEWIPSLASEFRRLRILSIPCSSGEEPYSIAMTLLRCGLSKEHFTIDAADINPVNLERAALGLYTKNSFRSDLLWFKEQHFTQEGTRFALEQRVKDCVSFRRWNLLELIPPTTPEAQYDIVFCRNLLIYFDEPSQRRAYGLLSSLTKEGGLLFLGHAEATSLLLGSSFATVQAKGSFAFRKVKPKDVPQPWDPTDTQRLLRVFRKDHQASSTTRKTHPKIALSRQATPVSRVVVRPLSPVVAPVSVTVAAQPSKPQAADGPLDKVRALADAGQLKDAVELCKSHIAVNKLDPDGYFLYAVILLMMKRDAEAENFLNKALFLKPDHADALLRLAALKEGRGDFKGAALCRRRVGRNDGGGR